MPTESGFHSRSHAPGPLDPDREGFAEVYREFAGSVRRAALKIVRNDSDADDVAQQTFVQAWAQRDRYDPSRGDTRAWLIRIARSRATDHLRARRRRATTPLLDDADDRAEPQIVNALELQQLAGRAAAALQGISPDARRILVLAYAEGLTQRQIAAITGRPIGTVKTMLRNALRAVRELVSDESRPAGSVPEGDAAEVAFTTALVAEPDRSFVACRRRGPRLPPLGGLHVLAVDDDTHTRSLLDGIFRRTGAHVTLCRDTADGLAALRAVWPDVLIADINMPGVDGYGLMRHVRLMMEQQDRRLPALAFTACGSEADRSRARLAGFDVHLSKPLHPAALVQAVERLTRPSC